MSEPTPPIASSTVEYMRPMPVYAPHPPRQRYWLHALLLLATCFTTLVMGARMQYNFQRGQPALSIADDSVPYFPAGWMLSHPARLLGGLPFMAMLMLFFMAHEMGHYLFCRRYGVYATLPFFIPMPTLIGTMGAVIMIRSRIRSRTALFDIGIAGPIAGFVVALAVLMVSLGWSRPAHPGFSPAEYDLGYPLVFQWLHQLLASMHLLRGPAAQPLNRVLLHPVTIAAWVGMFATSLNLLPGGQLDGGHIIFSISPRVHKLVSRLTILILLPMAYYLWMGWLVWAILLQLSSLRHPQVAEWPRVSGGRTWLAAFALLMLVLTLTPAPFAHASLREFVHQFRQR
ncbi:MAG TPA: site-2 protease family protein [Verrucomicrobiae bacterium]|nr:site-2 protease family protein [Verrucomicrobiae bacterium]